MHVQFSDSVTASGAAIYRIGTTSGAEVNLEVDVIAKYVERILLYPKRQEKAESVTMEKLKTLGFVK